jgi:hypothetical protein
VPGERLVERSEGVLAFCRGHRFWPSDSASDFTSLLRRDSLMSSSFSAMKRSSAAAAAGASSCSNAARAVRADSCMRVSIRVIAASSASAMCGACRTWMSSSAALSVVASFMNATVVAALRDLLQQL